MAGTETTSYWDDLKQKGGAGLLDLALSWGKSKVIDVETLNSDRNIPDRNDLVNGSPTVAASDALGGTYNTSTSEWLKYGAFAIAGIAAVLLIKKVA